VNAYEWNQRWEALDQALRERWGNAENTRALRGGGVNLSSHAKSGR
jgi:hypothetical protein